MRRNVCVLVLVLYAGSIASSLLGPLAHELAHRFDTAGHVHSHVHPPGTGSADGSHSHGDGSNHYWRVAPHSHDHEHGPLVTGLLRAASTHAPGDATWSPPQDRGPDPIVVPTGLADRSCSTERAHRSQISTVSLLDDDVASPPPRS